MRIHTQKIYYSDAINKYGTDVPFHVHDVVPYLVTIKPTLACPARCDHCFARGKSFPKGAKVLELEDWYELIRQLKDLGTQAICVSGGEPMMYKHVYDIIHFASKLGLRVSLNTSGWLFHKKENVKRLMDSGLVYIHLSIDSPHAEIHDEGRHIKGLQARVLGSIEHILEYKPDILLDIRMVLHRYTYKDIPLMLDLAVKNKATSLSIDHIEHDFERQVLLLTQEQIAEFRSVVRPQIIEKLQALSFDDEALRAFCITQINSLFSSALSSDKDFERGIYWKDDHIKKHCTIPSSFMIIEGDGSVLPCNPVEYTRNPIMGNVLQDSIANIWNSGRWSQFRCGKFDYCNKCAMNQSVTLPFREQTTTILVHD